MDRTEDGSVQNLPEHMEEIIQNICTRLKVIAVDVERVQRAKELLSNLQRRRAFTNMLGLNYDENSFINIGDDLKLLSSRHSVRLMSQFISNSEGDEQVGEELSEDVCQMAFDEERWGNYFEGFEILGSPEGVEDNENRKCMLLTADPCDIDLTQCLLNGVRCFMLDLFRGPLSDNQALIVKLREAEINVSKQYGFPVVSTIFAKLSPRYQYTGYMDRDARRVEELKKGSSVILTIDREYSRACNPRIIYVNARFLLYDVRPFDIIPIGTEIQIMVRQVHEDHILGCVCRAGQLRSYMPVLFPSRCGKFRVSYEEVEDLTFAREVGINVVVSDIPGTVEYLNNLESIMSTLECSQLRLYTRVVLNEIQGCDGELNWITERYDGFLVELAEPATVPDILHLCPNAECVMQLAYAAKKPIIFDGSLINNQHLRVDPAQYYYTFYYPDKYLVRCCDAGKEFYFSFLQNAIFEKIAPQALSKMPYCDSSHTGADGLARAVVSASFEMQAAAIVVCGVTTRMVQKISHFRPQAPILFVSQMCSAEDYVSLYFNVTMLTFRTNYFATHRLSVFRKAAFALAFLASRKIAKQGSKIILVYNFETGTTFPEKYIIYTFNKLNFVQHLSETLFLAEQEQ
ncbi:CG11249 [Drosophila busckii]|uniref:CG11249 n=1 Tax=Drosophila busckii TaxID=30019 RepID=A0A0M4EGG2_DROBS|nr:uncharacterized protein LOC108598586 [Drosophila busckii]ALC45221.1 CG11249 [Drosophila busckii]